MRRTFFVAASALLTAALLAPETPACGRRGSRNYCSSCYVLCCGCSCACYDTVYYQVCFYESDGQYAGSSVSSDPGALQRQCENWAQSSGGYCTGPYYYPYNCPQYGDRKLAKPSK